MVAIAEPTHQYSPLLVAVGSKNLAKTLGTRSVFEAFFPSRCKFVGVDAGRVARAQPIGIGQVIEGAHTRAKFALDETTGANFGVGIEAGIMSLAATNENFNLQVAAVVDNRGNSGLGLSCGFAIPVSLLKKMNEERAELDRYSHELTLAQTITEEEGIVYHLTRGRISRLQMTEQCVSMALIPWLNQETYGIAGKT